MQKYIELIKDYSKRTYKDMTREAAGELKHPFIVPGSQSYSNWLWDWDSWLTNIAVRQIMLDNNENGEGFSVYEKGCVINFLEHIDDSGRIPISIKSDEPVVLEDQNNIHKPCLAQHMAFIIKTNNDDYDWTEPYFDRLKRFIDFYIEKCRHKETGLYFWLNDYAIGVDNDPCTFYRPEKSSASIYLNCLMYKELEAFIYISELLNKPCQKYKDEYKNLKKAVRDNLWDEKCGFYFNADLNLLPIDKNAQLHSGAPRNWDCLIQRIDVWSGFMAMWAGIATKEQAKRMVYENMLNKKTFYTEYGVCTLGKTEKMYQIAKTGNPSCWLGPIWGVSNWMCFKGLVEYGYENEARELAEKTIKLFGRDVEECGEFHEYYDPDTGIGVNNQGFQNWNLFVNNMIAYIENRGVIWE